MGRRRLEMQLIPSKKTRARTFTNRKNGIMKKASELSKLCAVDVGVIIFGPNGEKPHVWPQEPHKLNNILLRYQNTSHEERQKRASNLSSTSATLFKEKDAQKIDHLLVDHISKKSIRDNDGIDGLSAGQLMELINCLDSKLVVVNERIDMMKSGQSQSSIIKLQEVQSCVSEEQEMMVGMNMDMQQPISNFQCDQYHQLDDQQYDYYQEQRSAELMMMAMYGGNYCNPMNANMGDYTGLFGMGMGIEMGMGMGMGTGTQGNHQSYYVGMRENENGGVWNPSPLACCYVPFTQLPQQQPHLQQLNIGQRPF